MTGEPTQATSKERMALTSFIFLFKQDQLQRSKVSITLNFQLCSAYLLTIKNTYIKLCMGR